VRSLPRASGITRSTTGLERNHAHLGSRAPQRALNGTTRSTRSHRPQRAFSTTRLRTTPAQRAIRTTGVRTTPAQRASSTTGIRTTHGTTSTGTTELAQRAFRKRNSLHPHHEKACHPRFPDAERSGIQLPRARPKNTVKKRTIARAQRSAAMPCWARQVTRSLPNALWRGRGREPEAVDPPGMCLNSPGICLNSPGNCRTSEPTEWPGIRINSPSICQVFETDQAMRHVQQLPRHVIKHPRHRPCA